VDTRWVSRFDDLNTPTWCQSVRTKSTNGEMKSPSVDNTSNENSVRYR
jgi:hypothetical protein